MAGHFGAIGSPTTPPPRFGAEHREGSLRDQGSNRGVHARTLLRSDRDVHPGAATAARVSCFVGTWVGSEDDEPLGARSSPAPAHAEPALGGAARSWPARTAPYRPSRSPRMRADAALSKYETTSLTIFDDRSAMTSQSRSRVPFLTGSRGRSIPANPASTSPRAFLCGDQRKTATQMTDCTRRQPTGTRRVVPGALASNARDVSRNCVSQRSLNGDRQRASDRV